MTARDHESRCMGATPSFGSWLKKRRQALGLTQEALAGRVDCAAETVRKLEADARRPSVEIARRLAAALVLAPAEHDAFVQWARTPVGANRPAVPPATPVLGPLPTPRPPRTNLRQPLTPLVGREQATDAASRQLRRDHVRLLTLTGPPGIGKTRLAIEIASALAAEFVDGTYFIDLSSVSDAHLVVPTVAYALGIRQSSNRSHSVELQTVLVRRRVLLVLDNMEHVVQAAPELSELLQGTTHVKLLVTSREVLRVAAEHAFPVPPLPVPPVLVDQDTPRSLGSRAPERLSEYAAVQLFVQRAAAQQPDFALTQENALLVAGICCRLDGLPLAIELAAARVRHLSLQDIYAKLAQRLHVLTGGARDLPPRQRTLRAAIAWSYNLLDDDERCLFAQLAVFRGGCSLAAAEAVCGAGSAINVLNGLASLLDKSLLQQREAASGEARFVMLELIHEYAREHLEASGDWNTLRSRHAVAMMELAEHAEPELWLANQKYWYETLEGAIDNLRAALEWSLAGGDLGCGVRIISATFQYWFSYGRLDEGIRWTQRLIPRLAEVEPVLQIRLLRTAAMLISYHDTTVSVQLLYQALAIARASGDQRELGWVLRLLGAYSTDDSKLEALAEARAIFEALGDRQGLAFVFNSLGEDARLRGDDLQARQAYAEALALAEQLGNIRLQYVVLFNSGFIAQHIGDHHEALRLLRRSVELAAGVPTDVARGLIAIAGSLGALGNAMQAARLFGAAMAFLQTRGALVVPEDQPEHDRTMAVVRAQLGDAGFAAASAAGQELTLEQAMVELQAALDLESGPTSPTDAAGATAHGEDLTRREREVAQLIAHGLSNRAIAESLVITERTVEGHVSNILAKLGFRSRAKVAAWVVDTAQADRKAGRRSKVEGRRSGVKGA